MRFVMCKGLPASGKSTWAMEQVLKAPAGKAIRVNRDLLRTMLHAGRWKGDKTEGITAKVRDLAIEEGIARKVPLIISDDTNLSPKVERVLLNLAEYGGYAFEVKDFTDVPLAVCIERDLKRPESVGEKVIRRMYNDFLAPVPADPPSYIPAAASVVLVDVDGTLAKMEGRSPYEWHRVEEDAPIRQIVRMVETLRDAGYRIIFLSGRDGSCFTQTERWLKTHAGMRPGEPLLMRTAGDMRKDSIVKREIYEEHILGQYNVEWVLDDRDQVVEMWRSLGLTCLQVAPGAF